MHNQVTPKISQIPDGRILRLLLHVLQNGEQYEHRDLHKSLAHAAL